MTSAMAEISGYSFTFIIHLFFMFLSRYSVLFMLPASIMPLSCQQAYNSCFCPAYLPFFIISVLYTLCMRYA